MRELSKSVLNCISSLKTQLFAAVSIPLSDAVPLGESDEAAGGMFSRDDGPSIGKAFKIVDDRPGYLTSNGLGSLEIGATRRPNADL